MRYAEITITTGVVQNIIVVKDGESPPEATAGCRYEPDDGTAEIGGSWDGAAFHPRPRPSPAELDVAAIARIAAEIDRADNRVALELFLPLYAAMREAMPDLESKGYFPEWLRGVATRAEFRDAVIARRKAIMDGPEPA